MLKRTQGAFGAFSLTDDILATGLCRQLTNDIEPLEHACRLAEWKAESTGDENAFAELEALKKRMMNRLANRTDFQTAERLLRDESKLAQLARREVFRWRNRLAACQYDAQTIAKIAAEETGLVKQYNAFRPIIHGSAASDNEVDRILRESTQSAEVEAAWRASKVISNYRGPDGDDTQVAERLRGLVHLRNQAARQIGYPNGYRASLELGELDQEWLFETLALLERETRPIFARWKSGLDKKIAVRFGIDSSKLKPWHYGDRFFQTTPAVEDEEDLDRWFQGADIVGLTVRTFDELGFDIRHIVGQSDLFPGDPKTSRKCQHAFCTTISAPTDVRVLCNIVPSFRWISTNLHEFGHAIYGSSLDPALPFALRDDPHTLTNEAIALLMERHLLDAGWLTRIAGISERDAERIARSGKRRLAVKHLVFARWVFVMCHFERDLYENPDRDNLGSLWWDYVERFQQVNRPSPDHRDNDWAAKIHFVGYPAYYQNYLLGELFGRSARTCHRIAVRPRRRQSKGRTIPGRANVPPRRTLQLAQPFGTHQRPTLESQVLSRETAPLAKRRARRVIAGTLNPMSVQTKELDRTELSRSIKEWAREIGFDLVGIAPAVVGLGADRLARWLAAGKHGEMQYMSKNQPAREDPNRVLPGVQSVVVVAMNYHTAQPAEAKTGFGRISRYAWGDDYHDVLRDACTSSKRRSTSAPRPSTAGPWSIAPPLWNATTLN